MQAEQVHRMLHREEIISRLVGNRIGYGLFHPLTGPNPLAVLYVALTDGLPQTIQVVFWTRKCGRPCRLPNVTFLFSPYGMGPRAKFGKTPLTPSSTPFPSANLGHAG